MEALEKEVTRLQKTTPKAANSIKKFGGAARSASGGVGVLTKSVRGLASTIAPMLVAVAGLGAGFKTLSDQNFFEAKVRSLGVDSEDLVVSLKKVSAELKGQASVVELTGAAYDVASAGFNNAADASKVLKAASLGAVGGFSDINTVANATTSVLNAYGLSADKAAGLVDGFIQTQNDGKIVLDEYAKNIGKVAPIAAALGIPLSDLNGAIAAVTANGVNAEIGITAIRSALAKLAAPTKEGYELLGKYGVEINAATLEADGLAGTLRKLEKVTSKEDLFKIIGTESGQAIAPLLNDLPKLERLILNQANAAGVAQKANDEAANTIRGAWKSVTVAFQNVFSEQSAAAEAIIPILQGLANTINAINSPAGIMATKIGLATVGVIALTKAIVLLKATALAGWISRAIPLIVAGKGALLGKAVAAGTLNKALLLVKGTMATMGWLAAAVAVGTLVKQQWDLWAATNAYNTLLKQGAVDELTAEITRLEIKLKTAKDKTVTWYEAMLDFALGTDGASTAVDGLTRKIDELNTRRIQITDTDPTQGAAIDWEKVNEFRDRLQLQDELFKPPVLTPPPTPTGGAGNAAAEAQQLADKTAERLLSAEKLVNAAQREGELLRANSDAEKAQIKSMNAMMKIAEKYGELATKSLSEEETKLLLESQGLEIENERYALEEKLADIRKSAMGGIEEEIAHMEAILAGTEKEYLLRKKIAELGGGPEAEAKVQELEQLKQKVAAFKEMEEQVEAVANAIAGSMTDAFVSVIDGSKSAEEAMSDMMKDIAKSFINMAADIIKEQIAMIAKALIMKAFGITMPGATSGAGGGGIPLNANATGGVIPPNSMSMVGEQGPELITTGSSPMRVTNASQTDALAKYSPGGGGGGNSGPVTVNYNGPQLTFDGNQYISRDALPEIISTAAKKGAKLGEANTFKAMRNRRSTRQSIGI